MGQKKPKYKPSNFTKCPECHKSGTVEFTIHPNGDAWFECISCGADSFAPKLKQQDRTWR